MELGELEKLTLNKIVEATWKFVSEYKGVNESPLKQKYDELEDVLGCIVKKMEGWAVEVQAEPKSEQNEHQNDHEWNRKAWKEEHWEKDSNGQKSWNEVDWRKDSNGQKGGIRNWNGKGWNEDNKSWGGKAWTPKANQR